MLMNFKKLLSASVIVLMMFAAIAPLARCSDDDEPAKSSSGATVGSATVDSTTAMTISAAATSSIAGASVVIEAGDVAAGQSGTITLKTNNDIADASRSETKVGPAVRIDSAVALASTVRVTLPYTAASIPAGYTTADVRILKIDGNDVRVLTPLTVNGGLATVDVMGFSIFQLYVRTTTNAAPMAVGDSAQTTVNTAVTINVLSNDTDSNGDVLSIVAVGTPMHGTAAINSNAVVYTPTAGYTGTDFFSYSISDGQTTVVGLISVQVNSGNETPLSSVAAMTFTTNMLQGGSASNFVDYVKELVTAYNADNGATLATQGISFPVSAANGDLVRTIPGMTVSVPVRWMDPLTDSLDGPRFGANCDYISFFGDNWEAGGNAPQFNGADNAGWMWVNHEYISGTAPQATAAPTGQHLTFARFLRDQGTLTNNVESSTWDDASLNTYVSNWKQALGGAWFRVVRDSVTKHWRVDRSVPARRYDGTSATLTRMTGYTSPSGQNDHDDAGNPLPAGIIAGVISDCSGGTTPWGTIITAEENVQFSYGDLQDCWTSNQLFIAGRGFDPGANINPDYVASTASEYGSAPDPNHGHNRDFYGFLVEIDPGVDQGIAYNSSAQGGNGVGHRKIGAFGRANWENAAFFTDANFKLVNNEPIVMYAGDDRRSGRIFKFVSNSNYTTGMSKAQIRALLDDGRIYVAHFANLNNADGWTKNDGSMLSATNQGSGQWIWLSVTNTTQTAPNASALGDAGKTVGAALQDINWNGIGGFPTDNHVKMALFTACNKLGVMELNRPEDIEWNARDASGTPRLYVAFTNNNRKTALNDDGTLRTSAQSSAAPSRNDFLGSIFTMQEANTTSPGSSMTFSFWMMWRATDGKGVFDAANPDNIMLDSDGGVWFGTDGNFGTNGHADAVYYWDPATSRPFRVAAVPADAEATGPAITPGESTLFVSVQHPGEGSNEVSNWPASQGFGATASSVDKSVLSDRPLSGVAAIAFTNDISNTGATNMEEMVKALADQWVAGNLPAGVTFPLPAMAYDTVAAIGGTTVSIPVIWLDPMTENATGPVFGSNADYISFFGDGWNNDWAGNVVNSAPQFNGSDNAGWMWVNFEYISNDGPTSTSAPSGQGLTLARWLKEKGVLENDVNSDFWSTEDVDTYVRAYKQSVGGAWVRLVQNTTTKKWSLELNNSAKRYDATSNTLLRITGYTPLAQDHDDLGRALPNNVVSGIMGDCSGGTTPWGTIITAEENVQGYYGDLEACWASNNLFNNAAGFGPGAVITPTVTPASGADFGLISRESERHNRDIYGFLSEIDPGKSASQYYVSNSEDPGNPQVGNGHRKFGAAGRARWENASFVTDGNFKLIPGQPVVMYYAQDRQSGRVYKFVSTNAYTAGMTKAQVRALMDNGKLYVGHWASLNNSTGYDLTGGVVPVEGAPGTGTWIELDVNNTTQVAPNATALGNPGTTVGAALQNVTWNGIGGFDTNDKMKSMLFTAANKLGVMELNRPEDVEWNPNARLSNGTMQPLLFVAFTNNSNRTALDDNGILRTVQGSSRGDNVGSIFAVRETGASPATSTTFTFWRVWRGSGDDQPTMGLWDASDVDNLMVDANGGLWFGTDGNFGNNAGRTRDALYYLDLNPTRFSGNANDPANAALFLNGGNYGRPYRVIAGPGDSEATGPAFSSNHGTIFFAVQHPDESNSTTIWPNNDPAK